MEKYKIIVLWTIILITLFYLLFSLSIFNLDGDVEIYSAYSSKMIRGEIPYKNFYVVYPPLSLISFVLPGLFTKNLSTYNILFGLEMIIFLGFLIYVIYLLAKDFKIDYKLAIFYTLAFIILLNYTIIKRYDIFVAFLTILSIYFLFKEKYELSAFIFACGVLAKLYPIIFLPLYLIYIFKKKNFKKAINFSIFFILFSLIILLPFLLSAPPKQAGWYSFSLHFTRLLHCESLYGSTLLLLEKTNIPIFQAPLKNDIYGWTIYSPLSPILLPLSTILILIIFALTINKFWKEKNISNKLFLKYLFFFLLVFITFNKVLSPQYLIWILPFFVFVLDSKESKIMFLITFLTFIIYPLAYGSLLKKELWILSILFLRNFLFVFLVLKMIFEGKNIKRLLK